MENRLWNRAALRCVKLTCLMVWSSWLSAAPVSLGADSLSAAAPDSASTAGSAHKMGITITIGSTTIDAVLRDNATAQDFAAQLPLTLTLRDLSAAEKVSGPLPKRLTEKGAPASDAGEIGDIAYYAPWSNIAFYRGKGPDAPGVIKIATLTSPTRALEQSGEVRVTIKRAE